MLRLRDGTRQSDKFQLLTRTYIKPTNKLVRSLFRTPLVLRQATGNSGLTRLTTAQIRGKPPPSPIQYFMCLHTAPTSEWLFVPGLPKRSPKTAKVWTSATLRDYNSLFRPRIGTRSKAKLQFLSRVFQRCVPLHLHASGSNRLPAFLLAITSVANVQMVQASLFSTFRLRQLSNDIKNAPMQGVLTFAIEL